ncbi:MAG: hypothetical protein MR952_06375 [Flavonifractor plautii]|nr:hypothetical protein [Flavonifractor plautii]
MNENVQALFEMGKIEIPDESLARKFCASSKMGIYKCAVKTRFGFFCDLCLEEEILYLRAQGVHTVASCCGHGNAALASILTVGESSREKMKEMGYEFLGCLYGRENWKPKSTLLYSPPGVSP